MMLAIVSARMKENHCYLSDLLVLMELMLKQILLAGLIVRLSDKPAANMNNIRRYRKKFFTY